MEMIAAGRLPTWGTHAQKTCVNADSLKFLKFFLRKGDKPTPVNLANACRTLHVAFTAGVAGGHLEVE